MTQESEPRLALGAAGRVNAPLIKRLYAACAMALVIAALSYAWYEYRFPSWRERVVLPDGRVIEVQQRRDFIEGYGTRKTWLTFSLPEMGGQQTWEQWLYPTMIGVADGAVYVVGRPRGGRQFSMYRYPKFVYVAYIWREKQFERIPFMQVPEHLRREENVRWCLPGGNDSKKPVPFNSDWCIDRIGDSRFLEAKKVDLRLRAEEGAYWARMDNVTSMSE